VVVHHQPGGGILGPLNATSNNSFINVRTCGTVSSLPAEDDEQGFDLEAQQHHTIAPYADFSLEGDWRGSMREGDRVMTEKREQAGQRAALQKLISLREDGYYSNCIMVETTPFDVGILFGKIRPRADEKGQPTLVEVYEKQVYLSHLQARALYECMSSDEVGILRQEIRGECRSQGA
jgi:hypothetical protein